jgi:hypothetical protein
VAIGQRQLGAANTGLRIDGLPTAARPMRGEPLVNVVDPVCGY